MKLLLFIFAPILLSVLLYVTKTKKHKLYAGLLQIGLALLSFSYMKYVFLGNEIIYNMSNVVAPFGMALRLDRISLVMLILTNVLFYILFLFNQSKEYMTYYFSFLFLALQGLINGIFLSNDIFNIYVLIEVSTALVSVLIMFKKDSTSVYDGIVYLMVNLVGMAFFLFGIAYMYKYFGVLDLSYLKEVVLASGDKQRLIIPFAFIFTGVSLKCALMPLFSWLPRAHATPSSPSIVSAMLSGLFVKTGIYLYIRLYEIYSPFIDLSEIYVYLGFFSAIVGSILAVSHSDIKLILSYHTISQIGLILIGINIFNAYSYQGGILHLINHGFFKATLFLVAGIAAEIFNTRDIYKMGNISRYSKITSITIIIASLSISGFPLLSGGYSKMLISSSLNNSLYSKLYIVATMGTMISFIKFSSITFKKNNSVFISRKKEYLNRTQIAALVILNAIMIGFGAFGNSVAEFIFNIEIKYTFLDQLDKLIEFFMMLTISYLLYKVVIRYHKALDYIKKINFSFNSIVFSIVFFFGFLLLYVSL